MDGDGIASTVWRRMRNDNFITHIKCLHSKPFAVVCRLYHGDQNGMDATAETMANK